MEDLSLHILDIAENALKANASRVEIHVIEDLERDRLQIQIIDDGSGMDEALAQKAADPFVTTRTERRVGLGLSLLAEAARMAGGELHIHSAPGKGTLIEADFVYSHIDRKPLGDMVRTMMVLIVGNPQVDFGYYHQKGNQSYCLNTRELRKALKEIPINHPEVIKLIKKDLEQGLKELGVVFY